MDKSPAHPQEVGFLSHTAELIAVGTELLLGSIANTDAQMLSQGLSALGINVYWHTVVGDNPGRLRDAVEIARKIGTFETSILPYEDCCTVFTPRHPRLRPLPGEIEAAEASLDIEALVDEAVANIERVQVGG